MDTTANAEAEAPMVDADHDVRRRLALVLDVDDLVVARRTAQTLRPWFGVVKVGLELYSAAGPDAIETMLELGYQVFVDLKLHDIPTTVNRASKVLGSLGASYTTMHAFGGVDMLRAGVEGLKEGADSAGLPDPCALAVTILTSDNTAPPHILPKRVALAIEAGCGGSPSSPRASAPPVRPPTTRPGPPPPKRRSTPAPTCWSSAGRSPRRRTRSWPHRSWWSPSPSDAPM